MESLLQRIKDRYEVEELVEVLGISVEEIYAAFEDKIYERLNELDVH